MKRWPSLLAVLGALEHGDASSRARMSGGAALPWTPTLRTHWTHHQKSSPPSPGRWNSIVTAQQTPTACTDEGSRPPAPAPGTLSLHCPLPRSKREGRPTTLQPRPVSLDPHPWYSLHRPLPPTQAGTVLPWPPHVPLPVWASRASSRTHAQPRRSRVQGQASLSPG